MPNTLNSDHSDHNDQPVEPFTRDGSAAQKNRKFLLILTSVGVVMFLFAFANVPLFGMLCSALGIPLNPMERQPVAMNPSDRTIQMVFLGTTTGQIPLQVSPVNSMQKVKLGEVTTNDYRFVNLSDRWVYFYPVHNLLPEPTVTADLVDLSKCFCFNPQKIAPGARVTLPVVYVVSSDLPKKYTILTMNYSMFELTKENYEEKLRDVEKDLKKSEEKAKKESNTLTKSGVKTEPAGKGPL